MKPKGLLTETEYLSIVDAMLNHPSWASYLNACEDEYLPINQDFYLLLLKAIQKRLHPEYKVLNEFLLCNPGQGYGKHNFPKLQRLEDLRDFVKTRTEAPLQKPAPNAFSPELLEVVRKALEAKQLLTNGRYIGKKLSIKALYNILLKRGYILGVTEPEEKFATWFLENFAGEISGRALRNTPSKGQEDEETEFRSLIPAKK